MIWLLLALPLLALLAWLMIQTRPNEDEDTLWATPPEPDAGPVSTEEPEDEPEEEPEEEPGEEPEKDSKEDSKKAAKPD